MKCKMAAQRSDLNARQTLCAVSHSYRRRRPFIGGLHRSLLPGCHVVRLGGEMGESENPFRCCPVSIHGDEHIRCIGNNTAVQLHHSVNTYFARLASDNRRTAPMFGGKGGARFRPFCWPEGCADWFAPGGKHRNISTQVNGTESFRWETLLLGNRGN